MKAGLKRIAVALALIVVLVPTGYYLWRWYDRSRDVQTTNDAYVRGEITDISSRVSGYAVEVLSDDGMSVKAADVVVRIDPRDFRMAVEKAQAALEQAKADLASVVASRELEKSKVAVAEAALRSAEAQAKNSDITLTRATILAKDRFGTQAALDDAQAAGEGPFGGRSSDGQPCLREPAARGDRRECRRSERAGRFGRSGFALGQ